MRSDQSGFELTTVSALSVTAALVFWQILSSVMPGLPAPIAILAAAWRDRALLGANAGATIIVAVLGLGIALAVAFVTASISVMSRFASEAVSPFVLAQQTVPLVAIAPLVAGLIGEGTLALVLVTAWLCWFPAVIAMNAALRKVDPGAADVFRVAGATRWQTFARLQFPGAAVGLVAGVRASAGFALIGAIVAEYGSVSDGLGSVIIRHVRGIAPLETDTLFALVLTCAALGALLTWAATATARLALRRWL